MARSCTICDRRDRSDIDRELIAGHSCREVGTRFGLDHRAVHRHQRAHLPITIQRQAREALERQDRAAGEPQDAQEASDLPEYAQAVPGASLAAPRAVAEEAAPPAFLVRARRRGLALGGEADPAATVAPNPPSSTLSQAAPASLFNAFEQAVDLRSRAMNILAQAERDGDLKTALTAIREARGVLDHLARLEERQGSTGQAVPLVQSEEWARTRAAIIAALTEFPDARLAVAEALVSTGALR